MTEEGHPPRRRFWLTVGEIAALLALVIGGLNLWESHRQHLDTVSQAARATTAQTAFVAQARISRDGRQLLLSPLRSGQVITAERYIFPRAVLKGPREISAAQPRIEAGWLAPGLTSFVRGARLKGLGHGRLPVVIETTYVQDGDSHQDVSLYEIGYDWKPRLFGGERIRLEGASLVQRAIGGDEQKRVDAAWASQRPGA